MCFIRKFSGGFKFKWAIIIIIGLLDIDCLG